MDPSVARNRLMGAMQGGPGMMPMPPTMGGGMPLPPQGGPFMGGAIPPGSLPPVSGVPVAGPAPSMMGGGSMAVQPHLPSAGPGGVQSGHPVPLGGPVSAGIPWTPSQSKGMYTMTAGQGLSQPNRNIGWGRRGHI